MVQVINRSQALVLAFFVCVVAALIAVLVYAPDVYDSVFGKPGQRSTSLEIAFLVSLIGFIALVGLGVIRRWRWAFWLILVAFLAGVLRVPASIVELLRIVPSGSPTWYTVFQGCVGLVQFVIGLALLRGYRRGGVWGAF